MIDIQLLRSNLDAVAERLAARGYSFDRKAFLALEAERTLGVVGVVMGEQNIRHLPHDRSGVAQFAQQGVAAAGHPGIDDGGVSGSAQQVSVGSPGALELIAITRDGAHAVPLSRFW